MMFWHRYFATPGALVVVNLKSWMVGMQFGEDIALHLGPVKIAFWRFGGRMSDG